MALVLDSTLTLLDAAKVEAVTKVGNLANLDDGSATISALLPQATNALIDICRSKRVDPAQVTNGHEDFHHWASLWIATRIFLSRVGGDNETLYARFREELDRATKILVFETDEEIPTSERTVYAPTSLNRDQYPTSNPFRFGSGPTRYRTSPS